MAVIEILRNIAIMFSIVFAFASLLSLMPQVLPWRRYSKSAALIAAGLQAAVGGVGVARRQRGPIAVILPFAAMLALAAWLLDPSARYLLFAEPFVELTIIACLTIWTIRSYKRDNLPFEERFERLLNRYSPSKGTKALARLSALDVGGISFLIGGWRRPAPVGLSYHRNNATLAIVAIVIFGAVPELFIVELFASGKPFLWHAIDIAVHLYAVFWFVALYASFRDRPHVIEGNMLVLRRGLFDTIRVPLASIEAVVPARHLARAERRALSPETAYLALFESPLIKLSLSQPCVLERIIGKAHMVKSIYAPVDDQHVAIREILRSRL